MIRALLKRFSRLLMAWAGVAVLCAVAALAQDAGAAGGQSQAQPSAQPGPRSDGQIEMDVVHALDASAALKNDLITAATIQGEVTLSGTVSTGASKQLAESIAAHVDGVTKVHNNLQIGNPGSDAQALQPAPGSQDVPDADQPQTQQEPRACRLRDQFQTRAPINIRTRLRTRVRLRQPRPTRSRELIRLRRRSGRSTRARSIRSIRRSIRRPRPIPRPRVL